MVLKHEIFIEPFGLNRLLHIYVPDNIKEGERLPVMYMFDGHNLFFDSEATYGKSWGIKDFLDNSNTRIIVVGLECNHEGNKRLWEFSPYSFKDKHFGTVKGYGKILIDWMVDFFKTNDRQKFSNTARKRIYWSWRKFYGRTYVSIWNCHEVRYFFYGSLSFSFL